MDLEAYFKRVLFLLVFLGATGYALAAQSPAVWILGYAAILVNGWLVRTNRFTPLPRAAANVLAVAALLVVGRELWSAGATTGLVLGQFLLILLLAKMWQPRQPRDDAQILLLSILIMGVSSVNASTALFAVVMVVYVPLSLFCCLLFHLSRESARAAIRITGTPLAPAAPVPLRDRGRLLRSMRYIVAGLAVPSTIIAVVVFMFFPRGRGAGTVAPTAYVRPTEALTGFNDQVELGQFGQITQSTDLVAYVEMFKNGKKVGGDDSLLLRGVALDTYAPDATNPGIWRWSRNVEPGGYQFISAGENLPLTLRLPPSRIVQKITLQPTGTRVLFAMPGPLRLSASRDLRIRFGRDEVIETEETIRQPVEYTVVSAGETRVRPGPGPAVPQGPVVDDAIARFAKRVEVSGSDAGGPLAAQRPVNESGPFPVDEKIAESMSDYLRSKFAYTLDLTDANAAKGRDPVEVFLYDLRRGNCEYFAAAMTLMCQRLGLQARMIAGFRCDEFNEMTGQYVVRQSHAHTWVEVLTPSGWKTFDPTSGNDIGDHVRKAGFVKKVAHFFGFIERMYATKVVAYDTSDREKVLAGIETGANAAVHGGSEAYQALKNWSQGKSAGGVSVGSGLFALVFLAGLFGAGWYLCRLVQRRLPAGSALGSAIDERRLRKQLQFYEDLERALSRRQATRPHGVTQLEFGQSLRFLPPEMYDQVQRLIRVFYRIRFGGAALPRPRQARLARVVSDFSAALDQLPVPGAPAEDRVS